MRYLFFLSALSVFWACKQTSTSKVTTQKPIEPKRLIQKAFDESTWNHAFTINEWNIKDSLLSVSISHNYCDVGKFELLNNGTMLKSFPPKTFVYLHYDDPKGAACKELRNDKIQFNIEALRAMNKRGRVLVQLVGQEEFKELLP